MDFVLLNTVIIILISATGLRLALWVYLADRKSKLNQITALLFISNVGWLIPEILVDFSGLAAYALYLGRIEWAVIPIFLIVAYFFVMYFPREGKRYPLLDKLVICSGGIFSFLSFSTNWIIKDIDILPGGVTYVLGRVGYIETIIMIPLTLFILCTVFKKYFLSSSQEKLKIQYFLVGFSIFAAANLVINMGGLLAGYYTPWLGSMARISAIFLFGFAAYAIVKRELFGIKVILTDMLVAMMAILLLILPFIIETSFLIRALMFGVFLLFCFMGYFLVRYTHREAKQKQVLEQQVQERTQKIQEQLDELNRWHKATIGREMKMIELKKEIKELKEELDKYEDKIR